MGCDIFWAIFFTNSFGHPDSNAAISKEIKILVENRQRVVPAATNLFLAGINMLQDFVQHWEPT
jgi:hypothetical protein